MLRFSVNISMHFKELPFLERFKAAKECGFQGVEYHFAYDYSPNAIAELLKETNVELVVFDAPPGNMQAGDLGIAALPHRKEEFKDSIELVLAHATTLQCKRINVFSGLVPSKDAYQDYFNTYVENVRYAAARLAPYDITLLIEPLSRQTYPGYLLEKLEQATEIIEAVKAKNVGLQFDFYHLQLSEGNLTAIFLENLNIIKHIQIAGVPGRHEPIDGEINYPYIFDLIKKTNFNGWVGCEYHPKTTTKEGLGWLKNL
jgi:hydroxypyruvate isomerase